MLETRWYYHFKLHCLHSSVTVNLLIVLQISLFLLTCRGHKTNHSPQSLIGVIWLHSVSNIVLLKKRCKEQRMAQPRPCVAKFQWSSFPFLSLLNIMISAINSTYGILWQVALVVLVIIWQVTAFELPKDDLCQMEIMQYSFFKP